MPKALVACNYIRYD